jgi:hypothetical protein
MKMSGCDSVVSGQRVSTSYTEGCTASYLKGKRGYFPVVKHLKCEIVGTQRVKFWAKFDCLKSG